MRGGPTPRREEFPRLVEQLGEDPARWLDRDVSPDDLAPLIRGMDRIGRVRAWKAVEKQLARGPREEILDALDRREQVLDEIGERADRTTPREVADVPAVVADYPDRPDVDEAADRAVFRSERAFGPLRERYPEAFADDQAEATEADSAALATDGGHQARFDTVDADESDPTRVGHCKRDPTDVYIGRGQNGANMSSVSDPGKRGWLGNPFSVEDHGRRQCVDRFRSEFEARLSHDEEFRAAVRDLSGAVLGCWCQDLADEGPLCHGEVIAEWADRLADGGEA